jgi:predicted dienelactone hydrolase
MRPLEYAILVLDLLCIMWLLFPWRHFHKVTFTVLAVISIAALIVHFMAEGYRWHMLPAYSLLILSAALTLKNKFVPLRKRGPQRKTRIMAGAIGMLLLITAVLLPAYVFPVFKFGKPTGPYKVGTVSRYWIDHYRRSEWTRGSVDPRELMVQIWYPAEPGTGTGIAPYHPHVKYLTDELARTFGLPRLMLSNFYYVMSNSLPNAQISTARQHYPVLLFSHGFNGYRFQNTFQVEELASHGYIVVGIDHSYVSTGTVFPDGRVAPARRLDNFTESAMKPFLDEWVADARFVLDQLSQLNAADPGGKFTSRLDLTKVGYFGHSFGGAAAAQTLSIDSRFRAGINMDGFPFGNAHIQGVKQPFMHLQSDRSLADISEEELTSMNMTPQKLQRYSIEWNRRMDKICDHGYIIKIKGTKHFDFSDCPLWTPLTSWIGFTGKISPRRVHSIINAYTLAFFDQYLQGNESPLLSRPSLEYAEVEYILTTRAISKDSVL